MNNKTNNKIKIENLSVIAVLVAIELILALTPLGYLKIGVLSITFMTVPIIIAAITKGIAASTILGLVFGITSFAQCFGIDPFGTELFAINPVGTFITCIVTRTLMGFLCGVIFSALNKVNCPKAAAFTVTALSAPVLNTLFFMSALLIFFWKSDFIQGMADGAKILQFVIAIVGINGLVEWIACTILGAAISFPLTKALESMHKSY